MRYHSTFHEGNGMVCLDDYIKKMKPGQSKIYFVTGASKEAALGNPFMEPFKNNQDAPPVLILTNNVDEICFQQIGDFKSHRFANIETSYDEIAKDLKINLDQPLAEGAVTLPEEDVTNFSLWLKNELQQHVGKIQISKRLKNQPAVLYGQVSSSMRMVMAMMEQQNPGQMDQMNKNNTLEINPSHGIIVKLNELRKRDPKRASILAHQMMDNVLMLSGIPYNLQDSTKRNLDVLNDYLNVLAAQPLPSK